MRLLQIKDAYDDDSNLSKSFQPFVNKKSRLNGNPVPLAMNVKIQDTLGANAKLS